MHRILFKLFLTAPVVSEDWSLNQSEGGLNKVFLLQHLSFNAKNFDKIIKIIKILLNSWYP